MDVEIDAIEIVKETGTTINDVHARGHSQDIEKSIKGKKNNFTRFFREN